MVKLSQVTLAYGDRVLFSNADLLIRPGDKIGLVGLNGAGKTSVFRLIAGQETPDDGTLTVDPGVVVGYFSQDVGELSGRSALAEVLAGAGRVHELGLEMAELEYQMAEGSLDDAGMDRYGEIQTEFLHLDGYEKETQAQTILTGLGIGPGPVGRSGGKLFRRLEDADRPGQDSFAQSPGAPDRRTDQPPRPRNHRLAGSLAPGFPGGPDDDLPRPRVHDQNLPQDRGSRRPGHHDLFGDYDFYLAERILRREQLVAAQKRQEDQLAKEQEFIARFAARASHAAQVQSRVKMIEKIERIVVPKDPRTVKSSSPRPSVPVISSPSSPAWPRPGPNPAARSTPFSAE